MTKFLIAGYMGVVGGNDRHPQGQNDGNQRGVETRTREPKEEAPFVSLPVLNPWMAISPLRNSRTPDRKPHHG